MGKDNVPPSPNPPGGLAPAKVPMFVSMGFDDNPDPEAVNWVVSVFNGLKNPAGSGNAATYDGTTTRATFYNTSVYTQAAASWKAAYMAGFETGNHTINHYRGDNGAGGMNFDEAGWTREITGCNDFLVSAAVGVKRADLFGFRTPYLAYNAALFPAVKKAGFMYDCSIEEGHQTDQDGTNYLWPYTLDSGSPGNKTQIEPDAHHLVSSWDLGDAGLSGDDPARRRGHEIRRSGWNAGEHQGPQPDPQSASTRARSPASTTTSCTTSRPPRPSSSPS